MSYLTLKANSASTPSTFTPNWESIGTGGMQYRVVGVSSWTNTTKGTAITVDTTGIELKADTIKINYNNRFSMTGSISASGDVTSLTNGIGGDCALATYGYSYMFANCTSLTTAPVLPTTTLADNCYEGMFYGCASLTTAPALPATTLADSCYKYMFQNCTSLTAVSALPATTLTNYCYYYMFYGCSSLTAVPALPATTLAISCYYYMFRNCSSLIGYITPEPDYTLIHNHPSTTVSNWNTNMYSGLSAASTVPATPSSNVNYYFKPTTLPITIEGKVFNCIGRDRHST